MMCSYRCILLNLFHMIFILVSYASANSENECTENTVKCQVEGSTSRNVYQFFGDSSCQPNIKKYIEDAINTVFTRQNNSVVILDDSIKALTAKMEVLEKKIDKLRFINKTGYQYYHQDKFWYKFHNECKSWPEARQVCQHEGGDLISLKENNFDFFRNVSKSKAGDCQHVWVGTTDISSEGQWYWLNGERVSSVLWQTAQPDNSNSNEHCGHLNSIVDFRLNDYVCSQKEHFICQIV